MVVISTNLFSPPAEGILYESPSTKLFVNNEELGTGTLYITENQVVWGAGVRPTGGPASNIHLLYPAISLHAVQREPSASLLMVLNYELRLPELPAPGQDSNEGSDDDDDEFDADNPPMTQLRFVPPLESQLNAMYTAMNEGQALHPDQEDIIDDDDDAYMDGEDEGSEEFEDALERGASPDPAALLRTLRLEQTNGHHTDEMEDAEVGEE